MNAFQKMQEYYEQRELAAQEAKRKGQKVIGYLCTNTPQEIIHAAGMLPIRITGDPFEEPTQANLYMEESFCPYVKSVFDLVLKGKMNLYDAIVIPHSCDAIIRMAKYLWAVGDMETITYPPVYWVEIPHHRGMVEHEFYYGRLQAFKTQMQELSGNKITDTSLKDSFEIFNKNRALLKDIVALRKLNPPKISGTEALQIIGSGSFIPKEEHNRLLESFLQTAEKLTPKTGERVFISGSLMDNLQLMKLVESCNAIVVGDDTCMSDKLAEDPVPENTDPIAALTIRYLTKAPCPRIAQMELRAEDLKRRLQETNPRAVIFFLLRWCDGLMWDYVRLREEVDKLKLPHYYLDMQEYRIANPESLKTRTEALIETVRS